MKYLTLILKNLLRSKRRTILTVLSIAVSLFIFPVLVSMPTVANQILADTASSTRIACHNRAGLTYTLPVAYKQRIVGIPHVTAAVPWTWFGGIYHEVSDQFPNLAVDPGRLNVLWPDWGITPQMNAAFERIRTACLVGPGTMHRFHLHVGQQIMLRGTIYPFNVTLTIVGQTGGKAPPDFLLFRRDYLEEAAGRPGRVSIIWIGVDEAKNVPQVVAALDEGFANSSAETLSEPESAFFNGFVAGYRTFFRLFEALAFIIVMTIGLVAANTAAMSIRERRTEIAVLRSIGFSARTILSLLLGESLIMGLAGGLLGSGAAWLVLHMVPKFFAALGPFGGVRMPPAVAALTMLVAVMIGVLSAIVPATSAARRNIVDALRMVA